jgi:hypothetical protein
MPRRLTYPAPSPSDSDSVSTSSYEDDDPPSTLGYSGELYANQEQLEWQRQADIDSVRAPRPNGPCDDDLTRAISQNARHGFAEAYSSEEYLAVSLYLMRGRRVGG